MPFSYLLLSALSRGAFPVFLIGFLHFAHVAVSAPASLVETGLFWAVLVLAASLLSWFSWWLLYRLTAAGRFDRYLRRAARRRIQRSRKLAMIEDAEYVTAYAPLLCSEGPGVLVLTDSRLIFLAFRVFRRHPDLIADCDRLAVKSFSVRDSGPGPFAWTRGEPYGRWLELEIVGIQGQQLFRCADRGSVEGLIASFEAQPNLPALNNGIRRIHHLRHRKVLKRAHVRSFYPAARPQFLRAALFSGMWPGVGQLSLHRGRTGLLLMGGFTVLAYAIVKPPGDSASAPIGLMLAAFLTWLLGILDILVQRQIGMSCEPEK